MMFTPLSWVIFSLGAFFLQAISAVSVSTGKYASTLAPHAKRHRLGFGNATQHQQVFCHNETDPPVFTAGDADSGSPGVLLINYDPMTHGAINGTMYFLYESNHDYVPYKYILLPPMARAFVSFCTTFEGRIVRGSEMNLSNQKHMMGTWAEIEWANSTSYGDISLLEGNDGAAVIQSLDNSDEMRGFTLDLVTNAPKAALSQKGTGSWCLDKIVGQDENKAAKDWEMQWLDPREVYLSNEIDPVIYSTSGRFQVTFYQGII